MDHNFLLLDKKEGFCFTYLDCVFHFVAMQGAWILSITDPKHNACQQFHFRHPCNSTSNCRIALISHARKKVKYMSVHEKQVSEVKQCCEKLNMQTLHIWGPYILPVAGPTAFTSFPMQTTPTNQSMTVWNVLKFTETNKSDNNSDANMIMLMMVTMTPMPRLQCNGAAADDHKPEDQQQQQQQQKQQQQQHRHHHHHHHNNNNNNNTNSNNNNNTNNSRSSSNSSTQHHHHHHHHRHQQEQQQELPTMILQLTALTVERRLYCISPVDQACNWMSVAPGVCCPDSFSSGSRIDGSIILTHIATNPEDGRLALVWRPFKVWSSSKTKRWVSTWRWGHVSWSGFFNWLQKYAPEIKDRWNFVSV